MFLLSCKDLGTRETLLKRVNLVNIRNNKNQGLPFPMARLVQCVVDALVTPSWFVDSQRDGVRKFVSGQKGERRCPEKQHWSLQPQACLLLCAGRRERVVGCLVNKFPGSSFFPVVPRLPPYTPLKCSRFLLTKSTWQGLFSRD